MVEGREFFNSVLSQDLFAVLYEVLFTGASKRFSKWRGLTLKSRIGSGYNSETQYFMNSLDDRKYNSCIEKRY